MPAPTAPPRSNARSLGWLAAAVMVAVVLGAPAFLDQGVTLRRGFNEKPLRALEKARPQGVLIGDSMLGRASISVPWMA